MRSRGAKAIGLVTALSLCLGSKAAIELLDPNEEVVLDISCKILFSGQHNPISATAVFDHIPISTKENWEELTQEDECRAAFSKRADMLTEGHMKDLLKPEWGFAGAPTPDERFSVLYELGMLKEMIPWHIFESEHISHISNYPFSEISNWTNFKPKVLAELLEQHQFRHELPAPRLANRDYIRHLLGHELFLCAERSLWYIFDNSFATLSAHKESKLMQPYADMLVKLSTQSLSLADSAIIAVRLQSLVLSLLSANGGSGYSDAEISRVAEEKLGAIVRNLCPDGRCQHPVIKSLLSSWSPGIKAYINAEGRLLGSLNTILVGEGPSPDREVVEEAVSLTDFVNLLEGKSLNQRLVGFLVDYSSIYPLTRREIKENIKYIKGCLDRTLTELRGALQPVQEEAKETAENIPLRAFRLLSMMLTAGVSEVVPFLDAVEAMIGEQRVTLREALCATLAANNLHPVAAALVKTPDQLRLVAYRDFSPPYPPIEIDLLDGVISIKPMVEKVIAEPLRFASSRTTVQYGVGCDMGGPTRTLHDDLSEFAQANVIEKYPGGYRPKLYIEARAGTLAGLVFAKAFQSLNPPHVSFGPEFFTALPNINDEAALKTLFNQLYQDKLLLIRNSLSIGHLDGDNEFFSSDLYVMPIEELRPLSVFESRHSEDLWMLGYRGTLEIALVDTLTNKERSDAVLDVLEERVFWKKYRKRRDVQFKSIDTRTQYYQQLYSHFYDEFRGFMRNFEQVFGRVFHLSVLPYVKRMDALTELFARDKLTADMLLKVLTVEPEGAVMIQSFFLGHTVDALDFFKDFVNELSSSELGRLLKVWTGSSYITKGRGKYLKLIFLDLPKSGNDNSYPALSHEELTTCCTVLGRTSSDPVCSLEAHMRELKVRMEGDDEIESEGDKAETFNDAAESTAHSPLIECDKEGEASLDESTSTSTSSKEEEGGKSEPEVVTLKKNLRFWEIMGRLVEKQRIALNLPETATLVQASNYISLPRIITCFHRQLIYKRSCLDMAQAWGVTFFTDARLDEFYDVTPPDNLPFPLSNGQGSD